MICCIPSFGWFPGIWIFCTEVSEHTVGRIKSRRQGNHPPKEIKQYSQHGESSKYENYLSSVHWTPLIRTNTLQIWWPWRHNTQLYYNPHVVLMAFQNVLCLNVTVRLPASFLTSLCPSLFIPVSFHSCLFSFQFSFIFHFSLPVSFVPFVFFIPCP